MVLVGTVAKAAATHLSVLAYGVFNATLTKPRRSSSSGGSGDAWTAANGSEVEVGSAVTFRVSSMQHGEGLLSMDGHLLDKATQQPTPTLATAAQQRSKATPMTAKAEKETLAKAKVATRPASAGQKRPAADEADSDADSDGPATPGAAVKVKGNKGVARKERRKAEKEEKKKQALAAAAPSAGAEAVEKTEKKKKKEKKEKKERKEEKEKKERKEGR